MHNLILLSHLLAICTEGEKPLIDYFQSHVVTYFEYLVILRMKTMKKTVAKEIRIGKIKDKEDRQAKRVA